MVGTAKEREVELKVLYPTWDSFTLWTYFEKNCRRFYAREFVVDGDKIYTYGSVLEQAERAARGLQAFGLRKGSRVAVKLKNRVEYVAVIFALAKIGCIRISINTGIRQEEQSYLLQYADAEFLISEEVVRVWKDKHAPTGRVLVAELGAPQRAPLPWEDLLTLALADSVEEETESENAHPSPSEVCELMFTSGSTSRPKGVMLTHDMVLRSAFATANTRHMETGRRICLPIPLFHAMAYVEGLLAALTVGGCVLLSRIKFDVQDTLERMIRYRANDIVCVSSVMVRLLTQGRRPDEGFPDMHAAYWAASCPDWVWGKAGAFFGIRDIGTGYGMTECGSTSNLFVGTEIPDGYIGKCHGCLKHAGVAAVPEGTDRLLELEIRNMATGKRCSPGEVGEIVFRGITVTPGYYKDPEATAKALDRDGWFHSQDLGVMDGKGYLTFLGRNDDMYKVNGENVSPWYIEEIIGRQKNVKQVEVVGIPHACCGQVGVAFVEVYRRSRKSENELVRFCKENLARFQQPAYIFLMNGEDWPKTGSGKISKGKLRKLAIEEIQNQKEAK